MQPVNHLLHKGTEIQDIKEIIEDSVVVDVASRERGIFEARGYVMSGWFSRGHIPGRGKVVLVKPTDQVERAFYKKNAKRIASLTCKNVDNSYQWVISGVNDNFGYLAGVTKVNSTPAYKKQICLVK